MNRLQPQMSRRDDTPHSSYVLLTAAYNEEAFIEKTIQSILEQRIRPTKWIIVSDGSTDHTDDIVRGYCAANSFIQFVPVPRCYVRGVISKVNALHVGYRELNGVAYDFIGNVDADISFDSSYFVTLLERFAADESLGIAGGMIHETQGKTFTSRRSNSVRSVAHAVQLLRRQCYESIGGFMPLKYGGEDWCAEVTARMKGWRVVAFPDLKVMHHRPTGAADRLLKHRFRQGRMDFSVGSLFMFEVVKCLRRIPETPIIVGAIARLAGFGWSYIRGEATLVSPQVVEYLRTEQKRRLMRLLVR